MQSSLSCLLHPRTVRSKFQHAPSSTRPAPEPHRQASPAPSSIQIEKSSIPSSATSPYLLLASSPTSRLARARRQGTRSPPWPPEGASSVLFCTRSGRKRTDPSSPCSSTTSFPSRCRAKFPCIPLPPLLRSNRAVARVPRLGPVPPQGPTNPARSPDRPASPPH
ncbi:hypothetical protein ACQJBY_057754 [Aegilops geniculata]